MKRKTDRQKFALSCCDSAQGYLENLNHLRNYDEELAEVISIAVSCEDTDTLSDIWQSIYEE